jgi:DNA polymerase III epsilon subunit-like protein
MKQLILIFDTETSDKAKHFKNAEEDLNNYPHLMQLGAELFEIDTDDFNARPKFIYSLNALVKPTRNNLPIQLAEEAFKVHGISLQDCLDNGDEMFTVAMIFQGLLSISHVIVCHNYQFDRNVMVSELLRLGIKPNIKIGTKSLCTMKYTTDLLKLPNPKFGGAFKWPRLDELFRHCTGKELTEEYKAHDALGDVGATRDCFLHLIRTDDKLQMWLKNEINSIY